jgi:hypothetical protein
MASLRKRNEFWYIRYRDETGKQTERKASRDKSVAKSMAKSLEDRVSGIKLGTLDPRDSDAMEAERVSITQHVSEYIASLDVSPIHLENVTHRLGWFLEETKIGRLSQLPPLAGGLRLEGPERRRALRSDHPALRGLLEVVREVVLAGSADPHRPFGRTETSQGRHDIEAIGLDSRSGRPADRSYSARPTPAQDDRRRSGMALHAGDDDRSATWRVAVPDSRVVLPRWQPPSGKPPRPRHQEFR